ncbi:MAG: 3-hydroxy-5-phosphonooxypentane-2,4-dione thiolase [Tannerella sp.]|jgi:putative autoinducer-2 (AI-2) aldolase|nr:3-hydroxy-5-phosphonooxypentane-2,4-dione thiolase [Tannerella sp.]
MTEKEEIMLDKNEDLGMNNFFDNKSFFLKGTDHVGWGLKNRMSRIFNPKTGRTVMLAFDHGSVLDSTAGFDQLNLSMPPLIHFADSIMCTRGIVRAVISPSTRKPVCLRFTAASTVLSELNNDTILDVEDAIRLNASALGVTVILGDKYEAQTIRNLVLAVDSGYKYDIPVMGITSISKQDCDAAYYAMVARVCAENGANMVKTYYTEKNFSKVVNKCPVPVIVAGGKKMPEQKFLEFCYRAIDQGAAGINVGRNVFQASSPVAMIKAISSIVHDNLLPEDAFQLYRELSNLSY